MRRVVFGGDGLSFGGTFTRGDFALFFFVREAFEYVDGQRIVERHRRNRAREALGNHRGAHEGQQHLMVGGHFHDDDE